ncbi:MAG: hypothetical protein DRQ61_01125 [Gammaproteobacteria bacterium]|nr:MAG: hypothetical protein DRQ56_03845 [Gammaproteobacteria bacterium]RLA24369.1 MAG: hypothetical protein DRQ61_01125 [Gammaproteobacteria bacterium]
MRSFYNLADQSIEVELLRRAASQLLIHNGEESTITIKALGDDEYRVTVDGCSASLFAIQKGDQFFIHLNGNNYQIECEDEAQSASGGLSDADKVVANAPMPGTVVSVNVTTGQTVKSGESLIVIESMKMETTIAAWRDGVVCKINFGVGDSFDRQAELIQLEE